MDIRCVRKQQGKSLQHKSGLPGLGLGVCMVVPGAF